MKALVFVSLLWLVGCCTCPKPQTVQTIQFDKDGCWMMDKCNKCCPILGGGYSCTLMACGRGED